jgi:hypothetical protein
MLLIAQPIYLWLQVVIPSAAQVARAWEGALGTTTVQQVLTTHRKQL